MLYGDLIKERRALLGLTQQELSDYSGLSVRHIKNMEAEKANPSLSNLEKLAEVLGLEIVIRVRRMSR